MSEHIIIRIIYDISFGKAAYVPTGLWLCYCGVYIYLCPAEQLAPFLDSSADKFVESLYRKVLEVHGHVWVQVVC